MTRHDGVELEGEFSPFIRACIGIGIVLFAGGVAACLCLWAAPPFVRALGDVIVALRG